MSPIAIRSTGSTCNTAEITPAATVSSYAFLPPHTDKQIAALAASILECGQQTAIVRDEDGAIIAGHGILRAIELLREQGHDVRPEFASARGLEQHEKVALAFVTNAEWRDSLDQAQQRELVKQHLLADGATSDAEIGRRCGVAGRTVSRISKRLEAQTGYRRPTERRGRDGRTTDTAGIGRRANASQPQSGQGGTENNGENNSQRPRSEGTDFSDQRNEEAEPTDSDTLHFLQELRRLAEEGRRSRSLPEALGIIDRMEILGQHIARASVRSAAVVDGTFQMMHLEATT